MRIAPLIAGLLLALPTLSSAQEQQGSAQAQQGPAKPDDIKINQLIVYGSDPCPVSSDLEITVCARRPEGDRFRIPEPLRDTPNTVGNTSWATRARTMEVVSRTGIGSCTPVGSGGASGCFTQLVEKAKAERREGHMDNWNQLIEDARKDRLGKIDAQSDEIERQVKEEEAREAAQP